MSAHGIGPAWRQDGDGVPIQTITAFHGLDEFCEIDFLGDVTATINLAAVCTIDDGNVAGFINMLEACSIDTTGDVTATVNLSFVQVMLMIS